mmetsp:Transcript_2196/g.6342  ORF Transcript_2196/g.6342 Transcript_2196/m.6342 type:complete len:284 (-) Transcript_2196:143-994(-)
MDTVALVLGVLRSNLLENFHLFRCSLAHDVVVPDHFDGHWTVLGSEVHAAQHRGENTLAKGAPHLIPSRDQLADTCPVVALAVVPVRLEIRVVALVQIELGHSRPLARSLLGLRRENVKAHVTGTTCLGLLCGSWGRRWRSGGGRGRRGGCGRNRARSCSRGNHLCHRSRGCSGWCRRRSRCGLGVLGKQRLPPPLALGDALLLGVAVIHEHDQSITSNGLLVLLLYGSTRWRSTRHGLWAGFLRGKGCGGCRAGIPRLLLSWSWRRRRASRGVSALEAFEHA